MSVPISLDDAWKRFDWAETEAKAMELWGKAFGQLNPYTTHIQRDRDRWRWRILHLLKPEVEAEQLAKGSRLLGGFLDNMRACLNYLTYQLALLDNRERPGLPRKYAVRPDGIEFPIYLDPDSYRYSSSEVKKLPDKYRLPLEAVQPYNGRYPGLRMLHEMAREYRHRLIHPLGLYPFGEHDGFSEVLPPTAYDIQFGKTWGNLESYDELVSFKTSVPLDPDDYPKLVVAIGIQHPECDGMSAIHALAKIAADVYDVLMEWTNEPWPPLPRKP
jgi:hypothetical protein